MNIDEIKQALDYFTPEFPRQALQAAIEQREAITPILLDCLEYTAEHPEQVANNQSAALHFFAFYLVGQFREQAAYPLLVSILSAPGELCFDLFGDAVTEDAERVLAAVCAGDLEPIKHLIENPAANNYARSASMRAIATLVAWNELERETAIAYFRELFNDKLQGDDPAYLHAALISACCDIYPEELLPEITRAFADNRVDLFHINMHFVERVLAKDKETVIQQSNRPPIVDTVAQMERWSYASPEPVTARIQTPKNKGRAEHTQKVGRNDPCPCGSGKKYKKCCGY